MKRFVYLVIILLLVSCSSNEPEWILKVGKQHLSTQRALNAFVQSQEFKEYGHFTPLQIKRFIQTNFVTNLLIVQEAVNRGLESDSLIQYILQEEKKELLAKPNGPLYRAIVPDTFNVSEAEINEYYQYLKKEVQVAHILVDSESLADKIYKDIQQGASFARMAQKYSTDQRNADQGGVLKDYLYWDYERTILDTVAFSLEPGEISPPVRSDVGYHIIKLLDSRPRSPEPLDVVRPAIRSSIAYEKRQLYISNYLHDLFEKYELKIDPELEPRLLQWMKQIQQENKDLDSFDQDILNQPAATFTGGSLTVKKVLQNFAHATKNANLPMSEPRDLTLFIQRSLAHEFMAREAVAKGLDNDPGFLSDLASRREDLFVQVALDRWIYDSVNATEEEVLSLYEEKKDQFDRTLEEMRPILVNQIKMRKANQRRAQWIQELEKKIDITYNTSALEKVAESVSALKTTE